MADGAVLAVEASAPLPQLSPQEGNARTARWPLRAFRLFLRLLFRLFFRVRITGLEHVPTTQAIICPNHLGWADPFLIMLFLPVEPRIYALGLHPALASALRTRIVNWLQILVALDPGKPRQALDRAVDVLRRGGSLLVFPEGGTIAAHEGELLPLQRGAAYVSVITSVPMLPVGITGTKELWLRKTLTVRIGAPLDPQRYVGTSRERGRQLTEALGAGIRSLLCGEPPHSRFKPLNRWLTKMFV